MSSTARKALLVGATGLVGSRLLDLLLQDPDYAEVHVLVRRPTGIAHPKLRERVVDFVHLDATAMPAVDDAFCCLGTTIRAAGSREKFRGVDCTAVLDVARLALKAGARQFMLVTAMGANSSSRVFYNRVKGEVEDAVSKLGYRMVCIFRPSFLAGDRKQSRHGEQIALATLKRLPFLLPKKYRPVADVAVARAMIDAAKREEPGVHIIESDRMQRFS
jgi:uncharacterized protein YbjT (DUF2867 family)